MCAGRRQAIFFTVALAGCTSEPATPPGHVGCVEFDVPAGYSAVSFVDGLARGWRLSQVDGGSPDDEIRVWGMGTTVERVDDWLPETMQRWFDEADAGVALAPEVRRLIIDGVPSVEMKSIGLRPEPPGMIEVHRTMLLLVHDHVGVAVNPIYETPAGMRDEKAPAVAALLASVRARECRTSLVKRWWLKL